MCSCGELQVDSLGLQFGFEKGEVSGQPGHEPVQVPEDHVPIQSPIPQRASGPSSRGSGAGRLGHSQSYGSGAAGGAHFCFGAVQRCQLSRRTLRDTL